MDQKSIDVYTEERETVCADITEMKIKGENKERELEAQERSMPISQAGSSNVRLPKMEIKKFNGEYHDWQRFHDEFETTINSNSNLLPIEKFGDPQLLIEEHLKSLQNLTVITN
ncbi:conserved hypothetical protein [Trichinella spiralis]|uniref:hypothetical protein n=1 Tax=Trichinella spiralis TaxID=6334 RepID=UPI0001EFEEE1|nr:conserved hypothetical protein [Trichinella spiralis]